MGVSHFSAINSVKNTLNIPSTGADTTLTAQQAIDAGIVTITLTAAKSLIFPTAIEGLILIVANLTADTHGVTVKVAGQTGVAIAAARTAILRCSGTDFVRVTADCAA